jgi:hypothetical protein
MNKWLGVAAAVVLGTGCNYGASAFTCDNDGQCGATGTCEPNRFCSFPDEARCGPGGRSFGDLSGGMSGDCVGELPIDAGIDAGTPDVSVDAPPDTRTCYGTGIVQVCFAAPPTSPLTIENQNPTIIDTANSAMCAATVSGADNYCVLVGTTITVDATLRATGPKPLVLIASESITVNQLIDVGSHRGMTPETGAGADPMTCMAGTLAGTRAGGAGGSFTGKGGNGGNGAGGGMGGRAVNGTTNINELRGGCRGQDGDGGGKGTGGHGGGAIYLIATNRIDITGPGINAAGEGGNPGVPSGGLSSGAGGGGSGGMIGFDAPAITCTSLVLANGGGGGEGSGQQTDGVPGEDPSTTAAAAGGTGGSNNGGDGGNGSAGQAGGAGGNATNGMSGGGGAEGGGGGGGGGAGLIKGPAASLGANVSPDATP